MKLFSSKVYDIQHRFAEKYTVIENADLCVLFFDITRTVEFEDIDSEKVYNTLLKFLILFESTINAQEMTE